MFNVARALLLWATGLYMPLLTASALMGTAIVVELFQPSSFLECYEFFPEANSVEEAISNVSLNILQRIEYLTRRTKL